MDRLVFCVVDCLVLWIVYCRCVLDAADCSQVCDVLQQVSKKEKVALPPGFIIVTTSHHLAISHRRQHSLHELLSSRNEIFERHS